MPEGRAESVTLQFRAEAAELTQLLDGALGRLGYGVVALPGAVTLLLAVAAWAAREPRTFAWLAALAAFTTASLTVQLARALRRRAAFVARAASVESRAELDETGLTWLDSDGTWSHRPWSLVLGLWELPAGLVFHLGSDRVLLVPRAALVEERAAVLRLVAPLPRRATLRLATALRTFVRPFALVLLCIGLCVLIYWWAGQSR